MNEDDLLTLFNKVKIETGKLNSRVIKAWYDTDCEELLKWMCSSITEDCYLSVQQESEYSQLDNVFTSDQLDKQIKLLEGKYPEIFEVNQNVFDIDLSHKAIELLEEDIKDSDHQIQVNQKLNQSLLAEFSIISTEEMQLQLEEKTAQENGTRLSQELDRINKQTCEQLEKYATFLSDYELAEIPLFVNCVDTIEFEEKFAKTTSNFNSVMKVQNDVREISSVKYVTDVLPEIENQIFHTMISRLALQMEVEARRSTLNCLETYDSQMPLSFIDHDSIMMSISTSKEQQTWLLKEIEEASLKLAAHYVNQSTLKCLKNELELLELKSNFLNNFESSLKKILLHFVTINCLYLQEKIDISSTSQFLRNINKYINKNLQDSNFRRDAMMKLISQFDHFCLVPAENKLLGNFNTVLGLKNNVLLSEIPNRITLSRNITKKLKKQHGISFIRDSSVLHKIGLNTRVLYDFLISGPTFQIVTIPTSLQMLLLKINQNLIDQNSSVKSLVQGAQKLKESYLKDKWLRYQNQLWMHFLTDGPKMLHFLEQLKTDENCIANKNI